MFPLVIQQNCIHVTSRSSYLALWFGRNIIVTEWIAPPFVGAHTGLVLALDSKGQRVGLHLTILQFQIVTIKTFINLILVPLLGHFYYLWYMIISSTLGH